MFTRCPNCSTYFAVNAVQLSAADGRVRCGSCMTIFDGLKHLSERPQGSKSGPGSPAGSKKKRAAEDGTWQVPVDPNAFEGQVSAGGPPTLDADSENVPEVIKEDLARAQAESRGRRNVALFAAAAGILLALLGLQYAWFKPAEILAGYPQARPLLEKLCAYVNCRLPNRREPSKIQMLARDVRVHPAYEGALLVSATLVNAAAHAQPYPRIQFNVFNVNGQTIASRIFEPEEYLSSDLDPKGNMSPRKPLQIALELIAPEEAAISYEFTFL